MISASYAPAAWDRVPTCTSKASPHTGAAPLPFGGATADKPARRRQRQRTQCDQTDGKHRKALHYFDVNAYAAGCQLIGRGLGGRLEGRQLKIHTVYPGLPVMDGTFTARITDCGR